MQSHTKSRFLVLCMFCIVVANTTWALQGSSPDEYAGNWAMTLGRRNFIVLQLKIENGHLTGTVSRPKHFRLTNGTNFSDISSSIGTSTITRSSIERGHLHLVVRNPSDKAGEDEYEIALNVGNQASLKFVGFPVNPWKISRVQGSCELGVATDWDINQTYSFEQESGPPNPEMAKIFEEDQEVRLPSKTLTKEDWDVIDKSDAERRDATRKLLAAGQLHTAKDFGAAAFIFQHGETPDDYLLAHTLATIAIAKGDTGSTWIAAATLDRYLQSIAKPQIYGTQFVTRSGEPATQEPYNRVLISDALRHALGVPSRSSQEEQLKKDNTPAVKPQ
jgi:hypothetical protein